jgi:hypothetical protein
MDKLMSTTHENIVNAISKQVHSEFRFVINDSFGWIGWISIEAIIYSELKQ